MVETFSEDNTVGVKVHYTERTDTDRDRLFSCKDRDRLFSHKDRDRLFSWKDRDRLFSGKVFGSKTADDFLVHRVYSSGIIKN